MLIYFIPVIGILTYFAAIILSILPKKWFPNWILTLFDLMAIGSGDVLRKHYLEGFIQIIINLVVIFLVTNVQYFYSEVRTLMSEQHITQLANTILVFATIFYIFFHSFTRGEEIAQGKNVKWLKENMEKSEVMVNEKLNALRAKRNYSIPNSSTHNFGSTAGSFSTTDFSSDKLDDCSSTNDLLDREWLEEVMEYERAESQRLLEEEDSRELFDSFSNMSDSDSHDD